MKPTRAISYFLVIGATMFGAACSTTGTGTGASSTSGSGTGASTGATSGTSATGAGNSGAGTGGVGATAGASSAGTSGTAGTSGAPASSGTTAVTGADAAGAAGGTSGGGGATDMNAFMGTFATMPDATFLLTAASSNLLELQAGQMAAQKATSASVKKFAQMMVDHHTKATQQLQTIAKPLGVVPSQALMPIHQAMLDQLTTKSAGKQFDEAYMDAMETAHTMDIAMFEVKSKGAETPTVQTFATKTLPMLRSHRTMAGELEKKVD